MALAMSQQVPLFEENNNELNFDQSYGLLIPNQNGLLQGKQSRRNINIKSEMASPRSMMGNTINLQQYKLTRRDLPQGFLVKTPDDQKDSPRSFLNMKHSVICVDQQPMTEQQLNRNNREKVISKLHKEMEQIKYSNQMHRNQNLSWDRKTNNDINSTSTTQNKNDIRSVLSTTTQLEKTKHSH
eukprot:403358238